MHHTKETSRRLTFAYLFCKIRLVHTKLSVKIAIALRKLECFRAILRKHLAGKEVFQEYYVLITIARRRGTAPFFTILINKNGTNKISI
jgi:hypothetical protein